jgi:hypothetical protein
VPLSAQLSSQVLQLLTRDNSWTGKNTFLNFRLIAGVPSDTALRLYVDNSNNLYFNGQLVAGGGLGLTPHNLLSTSHPDTLPSGLARGSIIVGNATPAWAAVARCTAGFYLGSNGTDTGCYTSAAAFTAIPAAQITGTASAFVGTAITALNASNLSSGTVPLAQLSGILNAQIGAGAAIAYSKLALTGAILNADLAGSIAYSKLSLTGALVTGDLTAGTLLFDRWASNACTNLQVPQYNGAAWVCKSLVTSDVTGAGTVSSVALSLPAIITVSGSPVTTSGTLTGTLATQTANFVWAGPTSAGPTAPTFRALVTADLPLTGIGAGTYTKLVVTTGGVATSGSTQITLTTDVTGVLPMANGGTGVSVASDDTVLIGSGAAWVAKALANCTTGFLNYTTATNAFACSNAASSLTASTAASGAIGTTALPFTSLVLGTAATNTLSVTPAAFAQGTVATVTDPAFTTAILPLVKRGTIAYTSGAIGAGTCSTAVTATVTGLATTSTVTASLNAAPQTAWKTGIFVVAYPTANTVNITLCNGSAGSISPESTTLNYTAFVP